LEAIGVIKKRAIEETSRRDLREVKNEVTDGYTRTRRRSGLWFEDSVWEILYGEVRIWVDLDERLKKRHCCRDDGDDEDKDESTEKETMMKFEGE
jgi:hypothetical protein